MIYSSIIYLFVIYISIINSLTCPNNCHQNGICISHEKSELMIVPSSPGICSCFPGFHGYDCSIRLCPAGNAWFDIPSSNISAHSSFTECSNMGVCNRVTGLCKCRSGFTGAACDTLLCPLGVPPLSSRMSGSFHMLPCSGNGKCISLREISQLQDYIHEFNSTNYNGWDADMIYGCACDDGYEGFDCSQKICPKGDDPLTPGVDEVQLIECTCLSSGCDGSFNFDFKNQYTNLMPLNSTASLMKYQLLQLSSIESISVEVLNNIFFCSHSGSVTKITFHLPQGNQPTIKIITSNVITNDDNIDVIVNVLSKGESSNILPFTYSVTGTREYVPCSNHGVCLNTTGVCQCYDQYSSSNGFGAYGLRGDCGYRQYNDLPYNLSAIGMVNTSCPVIDNKICSGNGECNEQIGSCICQPGYQGSACSNLSCPLSLTWFGDIGTNHSQLSECGGVGYCDGETGTCRQCGGNWAYFGGNGCEYLTCPSDLQVDNITGSLNSISCKGNGVCLTLYEMGLLRYNWNKQLSPVEYITPWDAKSIRGCLCQRAISIDNQFDPLYNPTYDIYPYFAYNASVSVNASHNVSYIDQQYFSKFYRGPYSFAVSDFKGYDCSHVGCPTGDDPMTYGVNDIQMIQFHFDLGFFRLSFRNNMTLPIFCNDTIDILQERLIQLYTISNVLVTKSYNTSGTLCNTNSSASISIEFLTEFGDLPLLIADTTYMSTSNPLMSYLPPIVISKLQIGTKEDIECSGQGICDEISGICSCRQGFQSSNGHKGSIGEKGDCTYQNPFPI